VAGKIGCSAQLLCSWGVRPSAIWASATAQLLPSASASRSLSGRTVRCAGPTRFCARPARFSPWRQPRPATEVMVSFIDEHRSQYGVEPICRQLLIAPSVYFEAKARQADPARVPARPARANINRGIWEEKLRSLLR
jgi:hypothetical protein